MTKFVVALAVAAIATLTLAACQPTQLQIDATLDNHASATLAGGVWSITFTGTLTCTPRGYEPVDLFFHFGSQQVDDLPEVSSPCPTGGATWSRTGTLAGEPPSELSVTMDASTNPANSYDEDGETISRIVRVVRAPSPANAQHA